MSDIGILFLG